MLRANLTTVQNFASQLSARDVHSINLELTDLASRLVVKKWFGSSLPAWEELLKRGAVSPLLYQFGCAVREVHKEEFAEIMGLFDSTLDESDASKLDLELSEFAKTEVAWTLFHSQPESLQALLNTGDISPLLFQWATAMREYRNLPRQGRHELSSPN